MTKQYITRKGTFDSGHRVMNERMKCFNIHGHTYHYDLTFEFNDIEDIGYAIDFKEIKRLGCQWIDDFLDHGMILNPKDEKLINTTKELNGKLWLMSLNGAGNYCNPSVENIAKEIFLAMDILFASFNETLRISSITLYETPNCYTICDANSISTKEFTKFNLEHNSNIRKYREGKGVLEYDDRKV